MRVSRRVDLLTNEFLDVRHIEKQLIGKFDNVYITFSTIDEESEAWKDQEDTFLSIPLSPEAVINAKVNFKEKILDHLFLIEWMDDKAIAEYVNEKLQAE